MDLENEMPTQANRISHLIKMGALNKTQADEINKSARVIIHPKLGILADRFLAYKREHGSPIEVQLYRDMPPVEFIQRLISQRPRVFMFSTDFTVTRAGERIEHGAEMWDHVGTPKEQRPLTLHDYLSYDEMAISSMLGVSSYTCFINNGSRGNEAEVFQDSVFEREGIYIGLVGARFERRDRMEAAYILKQPTAGIPKLIYDWLLEGESPLSPYSKFNSVVYKARMRITVHTLLIEANSRALERQKKAFIHFVGLGLGVWQFHESQAQLLVDTFLECIEKMTHAEQLNSVEMVDFAWFPQWIELRTIKSHVTVQSTKRNPADPIPPDCLLVATYAWDGNSWPGNEYWVGSLSASGDPAAACCSTIAQTHNPHFNPHVLQNISL